MLVAFFAVGAKTFPTWTQCVDFTSKSLAISIGEFKITWSIHGGLGKDLAVLVLGPPWKPSSNFMFTTMLTVRPSYVRW